MSNPIGKNRKFRMFIIDGIISDEQLDELKNMTFTNGSVLIFKPKGSICITNGSNIDECVSIDEPTEEDIIDEQSNVVE